MWERYRRTLPQFPVLSLPEERRLIAKAKRGSQKEIEELVLRHLGFIIFRIHKKAFPAYIARYGDDILAEAIFILYDKIKTYNLRYRDRSGNFCPVRFSSYIWKRIDGFILDSLKKELHRERCKTIIDWERFDFADNAPPVESSLPKRPFMRLPKNLSARRNPAIYLTL